MNYRFMEALRWLSEGAKDHSHGVLLRVNNGYVEVLFPSDPLAHDFLSSMGIKNYSLASIASIRIKDLEQAYEQRTAAKE